jgi:hypothetical protein
MMKRDTNSFRTTARTLLACLFLAASAAAWSGYTHDASAARVNTVIIDRQGTLSFATPDSLVGMMLVGATASNVATPTLTGGSYGTVTYSSRNPSVATVDAAAGTVTAVSPGTATILATQAGVQGTNAAAYARYTLRVSARRVGSLTIETSPGGGVPSGTALTTQPVVTVLDTAGQPLPGAQVSAIVASGTGTLSNSTASTGTDGKATFSGLSFTSGFTTDSPVYSITFISGDKSATSGTLTMLLSERAKYQGGYIAYLLATGETIGDITDDGSTATTISYETATPHGLIAAPEDASSGLVMWGFYGRDIVSLVNDTASAGSEFICKYTSGSSSPFGKGASNTAAIYADRASVNAGTQTTAYQVTGDNYAAALAWNYSSGAYSDWYLPSEGELAKLRSNLYSQAVGGFAVNPYFWSSSEYSATNAWFQSFVSGAQYNDLKRSYNRVRAVRAF